jgi:S1-C subfamily serine protease
LSGIGDDTRFVQISVPVQPGNSGGPLLDARGNLIGIVTGKLNALKVMEATGGDLPQNVNFAIKAPVLANFLEANQIAFEIGRASSYLTSPDLAEEARKMSVFVRCGR